MGRRPRLVGAGIGRTRWRLIGTVLALGILVGTGTAAWRWLAAPVDRLAERGLVERCSDPADVRGVRLSLTEAGRALQRQIGRQHARGVARAMTAGLGPDELAQLETICLKLAHQNEDALA